MKTKVVKIRTNKAAKGCTGKTLEKHGITFTEASGRLLNGRGLVSVEDRNFLEQVSALMTSVRKLHLKPSFHIHRGAAKIFSESKNKSIESLSKIISVVSEGCLPKYESPLLFDYGDGLNDIYSFRVEMEDMPSISGKKDFSKSVREKLDWMTGIPSSLNISNIMALENMSSTVTAFSNILDDGFITRDEKDYPINDETVRQLSEQLISLSEVLLASFRKNK